MGIIGALDASAYTVYCVGFAALGATQANLLLSGLGQMLTATFTRTVLRKRLTNGQLGGILFVFLGLAVRAAPPSYFASGSSGGSSSAGGLLALNREQAMGAACVALAALLYSLLVRWGRGAAPECTTSGFTLNQQLACSCSVAHPKLSHSFAQSHPPLGLQGVAYEKLLKGAHPPPPNGEIMWSISILGKLV